MSEIRVISLLSIKSVRKNKKRWNYNESVKLSFIPLISMHGASVVFKAGHEQWNKKCQKLC